MTVTDEVQGTELVLEKELRLALVLYGGVSLAIYMHGTTKELHRLVRASARPAGDADAPPTEKFYRELLLAKATGEQVRTRVVVDLIAGTSAGGINGVYLAKALAHDLSQDSLRDLWLDRGDIGGLLRGWRAVPWQWRVPWVLATLPWAPALRGDAMAGWLHEALEGMDPPADRPPATLLPPGHRLRLYVTLTDFAGYARRLPLGDPPVVTDHRHRHVMEFRHGDGDGDFTPDALDNAALAFAARATSCFPGAFGAVSFAGFTRALRRARGRDLDLSPLEQRRVFRHYPLAGAAVRAAHFVDGGVLDNRPFGHVIEGIRQAPAGVEVDRRLLYLEPSPTPEADATAGAAPADGRPPGPLMTVLGSVTGIPRHEPIIDEILDVGRINERVGQIQDVIRTNWSAIATCVEDALQGFDLSDPPADPADARLAAWHDAIHAEAVAQVGFGHAAYTRAKIGDAVDRWAATLCHLARYPEDCPQAGLIRLAMRTWARDAGLFPEQSPELTDRQIAFLRDFDLGYGRRRLRFVIDALSWWYDPETEPDFTVPSRGQLDDGKARLYASLGRLEATMHGEGIPAELRARIDAVFGAGALADYLADGPDGHRRFLTDNRATLDGIVASFRAHLQERLAGFGAGVYAELHGLTAGWHPEARRRLLIRHLGFPIWDAVLFPLQSVAQLAERDAVELMRCSPLDSRLLTPPGDGPKLAGTAHHNFGAFFDRAGRERDYLWGRLDAAERLVGLLLGADHPERDQWCRLAFAAVLDEEADALPAAADLVAALRSQTGVAEGTEALA